MKSSYIFSILAALLIVLFYLGLPELRVCALPAAGEKKRGGWREHAAILVITLLYAAAAFFHLGSMSAPKTYRSLDGESLTLELRESAVVSEAVFYTGIGTGSYSFELSEDGEAWLPAGDFEQIYSSLLKWQTLELAAPGTPVRFLRVSGSGAAELGELTLIGMDGEILAWATDSALTDEQALRPAEATYRNSSYFDEIYHARTAWEHLRGIAPYEISHPPLGKLLIALGVTIFGMNPFGWRFMGTLMGVLMLPAVWWFSRRLFGGRLVPACCAVLLATDFMHFTQTRIATIDSYAVFFILMMYGFLWLWLETDEKRYLALSGVFFGLGAASKWTCLYAGLGLGVAWVCRWVGAFIGAEREKETGRRGKKKAAPGGARGLLPAFGRNVAFCLVFFVAIPVCIYCLSYLPYAAPRGIRPLTPAYFRMVWDNQVYMFTYHAGVTATHPYSSRWYQWMLDIRPILYYLQYFDDGRRSSFGAWLNPILCWAGLLALFVLGYTAIARRDRKAAFLLLGYAAQLLPWVFISRVTFEYHYFACSVFLVLALGYVFSLLRDNPAPGWRARVVGLCVLSLLVFVLFFPAISGEPVDNAAATKVMKWLPTWPF